MAVSARASTFAVGTPVRQHTVARTQARRASRSEANPPAVADPAGCFGLINRLYTQSNLSRRLSAPVRAKYGDESQFFDLDVSDNVQSVLR